MYFWIIVRVFNPLYFAIIQMTQLLLSQMIWWWTAATWRRNWSTAWQGSGRSELQSWPESGRGFSFHHWYQMAAWPLPFSLQDVQLKVKAYILGTDMSNFKYDDFIVVLDVISRYAAGVSDSSSSPQTDLQLSCCVPLFTFWFGSVHTHSLCLLEYFKFSVSFSLQFQKKKHKDCIFFFLIFFW